MATAPAPNHDVRLCAFQWTASGLPGGVLFDSYKTVRWRIADGGLSCLVCAAAFAHLILLEPQAAVLSRTRDHRTFPTHLHPQTVLPALHPATHAPTRGGAAVPAPQPCTARPPARCGCTACRHRSARLLPPARLLPACRACTTGLFTGIRLFLLPQFSDSPPYHYRHADQAAGGRGVASSPARLRFGTPIP